LDTKSTGIRYSAWFKLFAVLLGLAGIAVSFFGIVRGNDFEYGIQNEDYRKSAAFYEEVQNGIQQHILQLWEKGNLFEGQEGYLSDKELKELAAKVEEARQTAIKQEMEAEIQGQRKMEAARSSAEKRALAEALMKEALQLEAMAAAGEELTNGTAEEATNGIFSAEHPLPETESSEEASAVVTPVQVDSTKSNTDDYENAPDYAGMLYLRNYLKGIDGLHYSVTTADRIYQSDTDSYIPPAYSQTIKISESVTAQLRFDPEPFKKRADEFEKRRQNGLQGICMLCGGLLLALLAMVWLMYAAGRSPRREGVALNHFDRIAFLDISLCVAAVLVTFAIGAWVELFRNYFRDISNNVGSSYRFNITLFYFAGIALPSLAYLTLLLFMTTLSKRFKRGEVLHHTIICLLCMSIFRFFGKMYKGFRRGLDAGPIALKAAVFLIVYSVVGGVVCLPVLATGHGVGGFLTALLFYLVITAAAVWFMSKRLAGFKLLADGVRSVRNGSLDFRIPASGSHAVDRVIDDVNNLSAGLKAAVDNEMIAERMKVELITNVSHDLRTPLTSIITYSDLLSAEEVTPEQVKEYSGILKSKSDRLKLLVDDLFEVSKAQSGSMPLDFEALCLNDLLTQTMAEYQEGFENSRLEVKLNTPEEKINILADGARMWRVLSNIFNNIVKYSMPGSRVYIDVTASGSKASVLFRNISASPMNFKSEEVFERFRRGDEARSGEGSGLGLAIVKSFMEIQKGGCSIVTDGDLFKLTLEIPLAQP
jgi:signal transduction histidine kinase